MQIINLDKLFAYDRVHTNGLTDCEEALVREALDNGNAKVEERYTKETYYEVLVAEGKLETLASYGTGNPMQLQMSHVVSSSDGVTHVGFLGEEYPRKKYGFYHRDPRWFMIIALSVR